jgi:hypothetical protein
MTRTERQDLLQICRQRERVAKAEAAAVAARHKADFEAQLARIYSFDEDEVWKAAHQAVKEAYAEAHKIVAARCDQLRIPHWAQPEEGQPHWWGRGENAVRERRVELTKVAHAKIDQLLKEARHIIEARSVEAQTHLLADGLTSDDAKAFLETIPTPEQLMPVPTVDEVSRLLAPPGEDRPDPGASDGEEDETEETT